jgi:hypothetical protein
VRKEALSNKHKIRTEMLKILVTKSLCFAYKTIKIEQHGRPAVATATTQNTSVLSTVFEISQLFYQLLLFNDGSISE